MQYVIDRCGRTRVAAAAVAAACTRPLGRHGAFYRVCGSVARDLDGARPPYEEVLIPPLPTAVAHLLCARLQAELGVGVAIVDINDFGGSVRATSSRSLPADHLLGVLADNPLRQRLTGTPFGVVRSEAVVAAMARAERQQRSRLDHTEREVRRAG